MLGFLVITCHSRVIAVQMTWHKTLFLHAITDCLLHFELYLMMYWMLPYKNEITFISSLFTKRCRMMISYNNMRIQSYCGSADFT